MLSKSLFLPLLLQLHLKNLKLYLILIVLLCAAPGQAQYKIDSLMNLLRHTSHHDTTFHLLINISNIYLDINTDSAHFYINKAAQQLRENPDIENRAMYHNTLGLLYTKEFKNDSAIHHLKISYQDYLQLDNPDEMSRIDNMIGTCFVNLFHYDSALIYYNKSLESVDSTSQKDLFAASLNNLANVYESQGKTNNALKYYLKALSIFNELKQTKNEAIALSNIGLINLGQKQYEKAIEYIDKAIQLNTRMDNKYDLASNYNSIGTVYKNMNRFEEASAYTIKALEIANQSNFEYLKAQSSHNLGSIYYEMGLYTEAAIYFDQSLAICRKLGITEGELLNLISLGKMFFKKEAFKKAEAHFLMGLQLCKANNIYGHTEEIYKFLMKNYMEMGKFKEALNYYEQYETVKDSLYNVKKANELNDIQTRYETQQKEIENLQLKNQNKLQETVIFRQKIIVVITVLLVIISSLLIITLIIARKKKRNQITILNAKNKLIQEKSMELKASNDMKNKLFSIIAHDLRSPFNSLLGFSGLLMQEVENKNYSQIDYYAKHLSLVANNMFELVDNLLNWTRAQQDKIKPVLKITSLYELVLQIISLTGPRSSEKNIEMRVEVPENTMAYIDPNMVMLILRNLISNAIKFTPKGGIISVGCKEENEELVVFVKDNGCGLTPDNLRAILSSADGFSTMGTEGESGSGLGLELVKDFVQQMHSKLWAESTLNEGTTFYFKVLKRG